MNGIEKITEKIINDAKQEADAIILTAQLEAEEITKKYEMKARSEKDKIIKATKQKEKDIYKHISDMAELEGRKELLSAKQEVLDIIFKEAFLKLQTLTKSDYISFLANTAAEASQKGDDAVILSDNDKITIGNNVIETANALLLKAGKNAQLVLSDEIRNINGGLIIKNGDIEINCTYEVLYNSLRNELATDIAAKLFN